MDLPVFAMVGLRPVKAVRTPEGETAVFALDWKSGDLKLDASYLKELTEHHDETEFLSEEEFEAKVAAARAEIAKASNRKQ
jgi:hypothetical protein